MTTTDLEVPTLVLALPGEVTPNSLTLPEGLSFEDWASYGPRLRLVGEAVMWWYGDWWRYGERLYGEAAAQAAPTGYSSETLRVAAWVAERVEPVTRVTDLSFTHHREIAALPAADQRRLLATAVVGDGETKWTVQELKAAVRRERAAIRAGAAADGAADLAALGEYQVLYADPPWEYEHAEPSRAIENQYPTMPIEAIEALDVPAAPDSVLFLWATSPKLLEALGVMESWGFGYRTCLVWVKGQIGMGYYVRQRHELLLIGKRGALPVPLEDARPDSVIEAPRGAHSEKPERAYEIIESMFPSFSRCELFARGPARPGWVTWGNQAQ